jgi:tellurite resistance protein TerC
MVDVPTWVWVLTLVGISVLLLADLLRGDHEVAPAAAARAVAGYVGAAGLFALGLLVFAGRAPASEFVAGYVLEYSLSVDNLFVYLLLMTSMLVPPDLRGRVLLVGIAGTLVLRFPLILIGAEATQRFSATFYVFGAILFWTAIQLLRGGEEGERDVSEHLAVRLSRKVLPNSGVYDGRRLIVRIDGRRHATPLLVVMLAVSVTGVVFALDSIPAIFGVTQDTYVIITANAFALMGLRQLYFVVGGLLARLQYLDKGLAIILGFIGIKLVLEALHSEGVHWAPEIGIAASLGFIVVVLALTIGASLLLARRSTQQSSER